MLKELLIGAINIVRNFDIPDKPATVTDIQIVKYGEQLKAQLHKLLEAEVDKARRELNNEWVIKLIGLNKNMADKLQGKYICNDPLCSKVHQDVPLTDEQEEPLKDITRLL